MNVKFMIHEDKLMVMTEVMAPSGPNKGKYIVSDFREATERDKVARYKAYAGFLEQQEEGAGETFLEQVAEMRRVRKAEKAREAIERARSLGADI